MGELIFDPISPSKSICVQDRNISQVRAPSVCIQRCMRHENECSIIMAHTISGLLIRLSLKLLSLKGMMCAASMSSCGASGTSSPRPSSSSLNARVLSNACVIAQRYCSRRAT